jgi:hypothetical protein
MKQFFFPSGSTIEAELKEAASYPATAFSYRPMTRDQRSHWDGKFHAGRPEQFGKMFGEMLRDHIADWNVTKPDGSPVDPKNLEETNHMAPQLVADIADVIRGGTTGDRVEVPEGDQGN